jgi:hypothetical protein
MESPAAIDTSPTTVVEKAAAPLNVATSAVLPKFCLTVAVKVCAAPGAVAVVNISFLA